MSAKQLSRAQQWAQQMDAAGLDEAAVKKVLNSVRDSNNATENDREEFYQSLAQQSFVWYVESLRGKPFTEEEYAKFVHDTQHPQ